MRETNKLEWQTNLIHGIRPVIEAIEAGQEIDKIFIQKGLSGSLSFQLKELCRKKDIPLKHVPIEKLNREAKRHQNHQGVIAHIAPVSLQELKDSWNRLMNVLKQAEYCYFIGEDYWKVNKRMFIK